jgi:hypothetical protein
MGPELGTIFPSSFLIGQHKEKCEKMLKTAAESRWCFGLSDNSLSGTGLSGTDLSELITVLDFLVTCNPAEEEVHEVITQSERNQGSVELCISDLTPAAGSRSENRIKHDPRPVSTYHSTLTLHYPAHKVSDMPARAA